MTNISRKLPGMLLVAVVCILTYTGVAYVSPTDGSADEKDQSTTDDTPLNKERETTEEEMSDADEEVLEKLQTFQRLLDKSNESDQDYSDDTRCIETRRMRHYQVLSERFVAFEMRQSDEFYLIQFEQKCPGLQKNGSLTFVMQNQRSGRLCVNDDILPLDSLLGSQSSSYASCRIPSLEKITKVQLLQLERGLTSKRVE
ncbi:MAG: hypothetical protein F4W92_00555 [Gammaproteobacteria bacterium]|nr:hypothetical protein [Gammaproteobacteria bacterium]